MSEVIRTERGWAGHFIGSARCLFRRNTLLECGDTRIVISTVGQYQTTDGKADLLGWNRYFETMAFHAHRVDDRYWDADVSREIGVPGSWSIDDPSADDRANDMHEAAVSAIADMLAKDEIPEEIWGMSGG